MEGVAARTLLQAASNQAGDTTGNRRSEDVTAVQGPCRSVSAEWYQRK